MVNFSICQMPKWLNLSFSQLIESSQCLNLRILFSPCSRKWLNRRFLGQHGSLKNVNPTFSGNLGSLYGRNLCCLGCCGSRKCLNIGFPLLKKWHNLKLSDTTCSLQNLNLSFFGLIALIGSRNLACLGKTKSTFLGNPRFLRTKYNSESLDLFLSTIRPGPKLPWMSFFGSPVNCSWLCWCSLVFLRFFTCPNTLLQEPFGGPKAIFGTTKYS